MSTALSHLYRGRRVPVEKCSAGDRHRDSNGPAADSVLRSKYLDYCSARLSEVFLSLSDERIYRLVEEAAEEGRLDPANLGFDEMVKLVTDKLKRSVPLPDFATWAEEYRENPERYDPYLLGLWEGEDATDEDASADPPLREPDRP